MASELEDQIRISDKTLQAPLTLAKNLEEYYKTAVKIASGNQVATSVDKVTTSSAKLRAETTQLTKDTQALVSIQKAMAAAVEKDAKAFTQLSAQEKQSAVSSDNLGSSLDDTAKKSSKTVSELTKLKNELKQLQSEMARVAEESGADSDEFTQLANRAGAVQDTLGDLKEATKAVSGEPIERFAGSFDLLKGKAAALDLKGVTSGFKGMTTAVKDLSFKSVSAGAGEAGKALGALGKALLTNPIFLLVAVVVGIGIAIYALKDKVKVLTAAFDAVGAVLDYVIQKAKDFGDAMGVTTFAIDDQTESIIKNLDKQREKFTQLYDDTIKLAQASGKSTVEAEKAKQQIIKQTTQMEIDRYNFQKANGSKLTDEQAKNLEELLKLNHDAAIELEAIDRRVDTEKRKRNEEARLREAGDAEKLKEFLLKNSIETNKAIVENDEATFDARMDAADRIRSMQKELAKAQRDSALKDTKLTASGKLLIEAQYQQALTDLTADAEKNRLLIIKSNQVKVKENNEEIVAEKKKQYAAEAQAQQNALDQQLQAYRDGLVKRGLAKKDIDTAVAKQEKLLVDEHIQAEIDLQRKILEIDQLSGDDRTAAEQKLIELKLKLNDAYYDQLEDKEATWSSKLEKFIAKYIGAYEQFSSAVGDIFAGITAKRLAKLDEEKDANDEARDEALDANKKGLESALKAAGDNAEAQADIKEAFAKRDEAIKEAAAKKDEQLEQRKRKEQQKQARLDKAIALSVGAIKLAGSILAMLNVGPAGFALAAIAAAIGAVQLAAIAAQPIPAAAKGIKGHKGGLIWAGELGHEAVEQPGKPLMFTDNKPTLYDFPAGTNIYAHDSKRTLDAMAPRALPLRDRSRAPITSNTDNLLGKLIKTVKAKPAVVVKGVITGSKQHDTFKNDMSNGR